ncbi:MAG: LysR family transcriptional regulator [Gammaproteobacteria bacterium]|nr:LysR family transcriptional regulator [Gammaproteobacteria bacterium]MBI5617619.1 LysR family transcriptional regulator [Gammaproteobacteria bacterium]
MDRFQEMQVFIAVADTHGFAPAARRLHSSPPAVTRAVAALEGRLGVTLFHRTTRRVRLTDAGVRFLEDCRRILGELGEAEDSARGAHHAPRGRLAVTASVRFGYLYAVPLLLQFLERYPEVALETLFVDRVVNLIEEGLDVAIRIGDLPDSGLTAIRVGRVRRVVCASPAYLQARGIPRVPEDLAHHDIVLFSGLSARPEWTFARAGGELRVPLAPRLTVNMSDAAIAAAVAGRGMTRLLSYMIAPELRSGQLAIVLGGHEPEPLPVHVVYQEGRKAAVRVRVFVDFLVERLRADSSLA